MDLDEKIIKTLFDEQKVQKKDLTGVFKIHNANKDSLEKLVIQLKVARREDVLATKAKILKAEPYAIDLSAIDLDVARTIPQAMAKRYNLACPGQTNEGKIIVAMHDPADNFATEYVQMKTGKELEPYVALLTDIEAAWDVIYASETKKTHPFLRKLPEDQKFEKKEIPNKFIIPGLSRKPQIITQDSAKAEDIIREAAESFREKAVGDSRLNNMIDSIQKELKTLSILCHAANHLNAPQSQNWILKEILKTGTDICRTKVGSILLIDETRENLYFREAISPKRDNLMQLPIPLNSNSIAGWVAVNDTPLAVNNLKEDPRHFKKIDEMLEFETRNIASVPIKWAGEVLGVIEILNKEDAEFNEKDLEFLTILASMASVPIHNLSVAEQLRNLDNGAAKILLECIESRIPGSREHSMKVAEIAALLANELHVPKAECERITLAAYLHDIGKIRNAEKRHPAEGAEILLSAGCYGDVEPFVRYHHEKFSGSGYPDGLEGESIPLGARIIAIAEAYAETFEMNQGIDPNEYIEKFISGFGTDFDPAMKISFLSAINASPAFAAGLERQIT